MLSRTPGAAGRALPRVEAYLTKRGESGREDTNPAAAPTSLCLGLNLLAPLLIVDLYLFNISGLQKSQD